MGKKLVRFDWAIKKLLRNKAHFVILEGFLSVVLAQEIRILEILESESNQEDENDKFNRVDLLVKNTLDELIIIEVQNNKELDYFQRMLFGTSKVITEHVEQGEKYAAVKKVYSITIAYFDLGQGSDYVYHGKTEFKGIHDAKTLALSEDQMRVFDKTQVSEIYPEYYIIKANKFDDRVSDTLDEWIYFLKNSEIKDEFTAQGLNEAKTILTELQMSDTERAAYRAYQKRLRDLNSEHFTKAAELQFELEKRTLEIAKRSIENQLDDQTIATITGIPIESVQKIRAAMS